MVVSLLSGLRGRKPTGWCFLWTVRQELREFQDLRGLHRQGSRREERVWGFVISVGLSKINWARRGSLCLSFFV